MHQCSYFELTKEQRAEARRLSPKEQAAVDAFIAAAKALPKVMSIELDEGVLIVHKRITPGSASPVAKLKKRSLEFGYHP